MNETAASFWAVIQTPVIGNLTYADLITIGVILIASVIIGKALGVYLKKIFSDRVGKAELDLGIRVLQYAIVIVGLLIAAPFFQIDLSALLVAGGFAGIVIGFASKSVVANLVSGIFLLMERPLNIGDAVTIGEITGTVSQVRVMSTIIRTDEGTYARVPNERVFTANVVNLVANPARRCDISFHIAYQDDAARAAAIITEFLNDEPLVLHHPAPVVSIDQLGQESIVLRVQAWVPSTEWKAMKRRLTWSVRDLLAASGITLPIPVQ